MNNRFNLEKARKLYEDGNTLVEVGRAIKQHPSYVHFRLKQVGVVMRKAAKRNQTGSNNASWKGDSASYGALHLRVYKERGAPNVCAMCDGQRGKRMEWANVTGNLSDVFDYIRLCKSCHAKFDSIIDNINNNGVSSTNNK